MKHKVHTYLKSKTNRQHMRLLAVVLFATSVISLILWFLNAQSYTFVLESIKHINGTTTTQEEDVYEYPSTTYAQPTLLEIPSINLSASFVEPLGLSTEGSVAVPDSYDAVGWYRYGPSPGEIGPSVILGHVDSKDGPGVFYSLGQASLDDEVQVHREDGSIVTFTITKIQRIEQEEFPTQNVYGNIPHAGIRLITCSGFYDKEVQRYSHNLIVYGTFSSTTKPEQTLTTPTASTSVK